MTQLTVTVGESDHIQGTATAPVTLLKYGYYGCPHCRDAHFVVVQLQQQFGTQLRFVFRHFPLNALHPYAQHAAETAEAAGAQGHFWEIHDYQFDDLQALGGNGVLLQYAVQLGLDVERLEREVAEHQYADRIREHQRSGISSGVNGTPTFFINQIRHDGACDLASLQVAIAAAKQFHDL